MNKNVYVHLKILHEFNTNLKDIQEALIYTRKENLYFLNKYNFNYYNICMTSFILF